MSWGFVTHCCHFQFVTVVKNQQNIFFALIDESAVCIRMTDQSDDGDYDDYACNDKDGDDDEDGDEDGGGIRSWTVAGVRC